MENYNIVEKYEWGICHYLNDKLHRLDGPAIEYNSGDKGWYQNGLCHRLDGPAIEYVFGYKAWYQNDKLHRMDGPAIEYHYGDKKWFYEGELIDCNSQEEFERLIKLKLFW
jgi:hypothetical protein